VKKVFVETICERDWVDSTFLVRDKIMAMAKNGKPYMTLKLMDRTGEVEGRIWDRVDEFSRLFEKDDFIRIAGKASVYLGKMQLVIQEVERMDESAVDLADFLPVASRTPSEMMDEVRAMVARMSDPNIISLMEAFLSDEEFTKRYSLAPAAKTMHHVYLGGLLEHSLAVASLAEDICRRYPRIDRDLLVAGALLHDIGKVTELSYLRSFDYTDEGKLLGHIMIGVEMLEAKIRSLPSFPAMTATHLKHLLLSHHGQYEFGSPKRPKTLEATVLNYLDDMDSKINGVISHIDRETSEGSSWTSYHRFYERYFFTPPSEGTAPQVVTPSLPPKELPVEKVVQKETRRTHETRRFGTSLADQLKEKSLDLFSVDDEKKE